MPCYTEMQSPIGPVRIIGDRNAVSSVLLTNDPRFAHPSTTLPRDDQELTQATRELQAYFAGELEIFSVPVVFHTGTDFQRKVWRSLCDIPHGVTASYREIADKIGSPKAVRAVGAANGKNPVAIIVPCHRVIGANGNLTGYAAGLENKRWLLNHEARFFLDGGRVE